MNCADPPCLDFYSPFWPPIHKSDCNPGPDPPTPSPLFYPLPTPSLHAPQSCCAAFIPFELVTQPPPQKNPAPIVMSSKQSGCSLQRWWRMHRCVCWICVCWVSSWVFVCWACMCLLSVYICVCVCVEFVCVEVGWTIRCIKPTHRSAALPWWHQACQL